MADLDTIKQLIEEGVPFVKKVNVKIKAMEPRKVELILPMDQTNLTPMGMIVAGAIFTLAETSAAALLSASVDLTKYSVVAKSLEINFKRPAMTDLTCSLAMSEDEAKGIENRADAEGKTDAVINVSVVDTSGTVVAETKAVFRVRKL